MFFGMPSSISIKAIFKGKRVTKSLKKMLKSTNYLIYCRLPTWLCSHVIYGRLLSLSSSSSFFFLSRVKSVFLINHLLNSFKCVFKRSKDRHIINMIRINTYMFWGDKGEIITKREIKMHNTRRRESELKSFILSSQEW